MKHVCLVCGWPHLREAPRGKSGGGSYEICPACGFQFGVSDDDEGHTIAEWRRAWADRGKPWSSATQPAPPDWDTTKHLLGLRKKK